MRSSSRNCSKMNTTQIIDTSILVQVMAWCHQATSHYLTNVDADLCCPMMSLGCNELIFIFPSAVIMPYWSVNVREMLLHYELGSLTLLLHSLSAIIINYSGQVSFNSLKLSDAYMRIIIIFVSIMSCFLFYIKPFPQPMMTDHQLDQWNLNQNTFFSENTFKNVYYVQGLVSWYAGCSIIPVYMYFV